MGPKQLAARHSGKRQRRAALRAALGSREVGSAPQSWRRRFRNGTGAWKVGVGLLKGQNGGRQLSTGAGAEQQHHVQQQHPRTQSPQQPHAHDASSNADKKIKAVEDT